MLNEPKESRGALVALILIILAVLAALVLNLLRVTYTFAVYVSGSSMEDTVHDGDVLYALRNFTAERGDIVIIDVSENPDFAAGTYNIIKRVIALEGDSVKCEDGVVYVKRSGGEYAALEEPYTKGRTPDFAEVTVGEGQVFFLGDHRNVSHDSTEVGTVACSDIVGLVPDWAVSVKGFTTGWENFRAALQNLFS